MLSVFLQHTELTDGLADIPDRCSKNSRLCRAFHISLPDHSCHPFPELQPFAWSVGGWTDSEGSFELYSELDGDLLQIGHSRMLQSSVFLRRMSVMHWSHKAWLHGRILGTWFPSTVKSSEQTPHSSMWSRLSRAPPSAILLLFPQTLLIKFKVL